MKLTQRQIKNRLKIAAQRGNLEWIKLLVKEENAGVLFNEKRTRNGHTLLEWACNKGHLNVVKYILESAEVDPKPDINSDYGGPFRAACCDGHMDIIHYFLYDLNYQLLPSHAAVMEEELIEEFVEEVKILIKQRNEVLYLAKELLPVQFTEDKKIIKI